MKKDLVIPKGVEVKVDANRVTVKGPLGELSKAFPSSISIKVSGDKVDVETSNQRRKIKALSGTFKAHIANMIQGVSSGYEARLKVLYAHFPIKVKADMGKLHIENFLGERRAKEAHACGNVEIKADKDEVTVFGINKEDVGQTAANIEAAVRIRGFDKRVFQDGIYITQPARPRKE